MRCRIRSANTGQGPIAQRRPRWTRDGSLLVFAVCSRRRRFSRVSGGEGPGTAGRHPALAGMTPELLSVKLMGRCDRARRRLARVGRDPLRNNDFAFCAAASVDEGDPADPGGDPSAGDPFGLFRPRAAWAPRLPALRSHRGTDGREHRDPSDEPANHRVRNHGRTLRRLPDSLCRIPHTSIERQFEFVQTGMAE
jgi:hypothetical protein